MTSPIVTETLLPLEPVVQDPFILDVTAAPSAPPPEQPPRRRRIWD
jgi:hypothetical protein